MPRKIVAVFGIVVACIGLAIVAVPTNLVEGAQLVMSPAGTSVVDWGSSQGDAFSRGAGVVTACLGAFLAWSAMPPKGAE